jgi:Glyoxalase-like domain
VTPSFQVAIDAADPHGLARFWAAVVDYDIEDHHDLVRQVLDAGYATEDDTIELDGRLAWRTAAACRDRSGTGPRLLFQFVPEPKTVKDRIHLDLHFGPERRDAEVERIIGLGATKLWDGSQGPNVWVTLADPEGNEFCVS